jgi:catechol 2,3-dioxygenase-like lactoylglutathione lyase family enzyme
MPIVPGTGVGIRAANYDDTLQFYTALFASLAVRPDPPPDGDGDNGLAWTNFGGRLTVAAIPKDAPPTAYADVMIYVGTRALVDNAFAAAVAAGGTADQPPHDDESYPEEPRYWGTVIDSGDNRVWFVSRPDD